MKLSHIKIQHTILTINNKKKAQQLHKELVFRNSTTINQLSILNSTFDLRELQSFPNNIENVSIRKTNILYLSLGIINGSNLKILELPQNQLVQIPKIESNYLIRLNLSHNKITSIAKIPCQQTLKSLDLKDNRITSVTNKIYNLPNLRIYHQFLPVQSANKKYLPPLVNQLIPMSDILGESIYQWQNNKIIEICEQIIEDNNDYMLKQLIQFLDEEFISKIFDIAKLRKKHNILQLLTKIRNIDDISLEDRTILLLPQLLPLEILRFISLQNIVRAISYANSENKRVTFFLQYLGSIPQSIFILSEKDLISFMAHSVTYKHDYQAQFLISQHSFFRQYQFNNTIILKYLFQFNNPKLISLLLQSQIFKNQIFVHHSFRKFLRPNKKIYKILCIAKKQHLKGQQQLNHHWYFPQYRQRKAFCIKNDLYDYQILKEFEQMQCSYMKKDCKYTIKIFNKQNQISVAKKIQNELKKNQIKHIKPNRKRLSLSTYSAY